MTINDTFFMMLMFFVGGLFVARSVARRGAAGYVRERALRMGAMGALALASPPVATSVDDGLEQVRRCLADASSRGAAIVCLPEAYVPGLRGLDFDVPDFDRAAHDRVVSTVGQWARRYGIAHDGPHGPKRESGRRRGPIHTAEQLEEPLVA